MKNSSWNPLKCPWLKKTLSIIRCILIFLLSGILYTVANTAYSQSTKLSLRLNNVTVQEVLSEIEKKSSFYFTYNTRQINTTRKVSVNIKNKMVVEVLDKVFAGENIGYTIDDKHIILYKSDDSNLVPQVSQQTGRIITGTVTDTEGEPLPGVNVLVKGTSIGMVTDVNGHYSINVPDENAELQFSFMGFATREFVVGTQRTINVEMQED
ncbi:MAG: carboxypeptidase-like regulatory domain-containing protein, partial [Tannerellaceae bacterium]|nr:carboxypeptidase-like regulatory domain-containing protein [Tannerellaceae bacterium]